jgi:predicted phage tail protein
MAGIQEFSQDTVFTNPELPTDTLSSKQFNTLVEVVGEGEIEGSATASKAGLTKGTTAYNNAFKKDIFLNGTQLLLTSADNTSPAEGEFNFKDVGFEPRFGTSNQTFINGISNIETETSVGVAVTFGNPITRAVSNSSVNAIRVTVSFNNIQKVEDSGEITGASAGVKIEIIQNNGTTTTPIDDTVTGRSTSAYFRDYLINLPANTSFPINVRVSRTTADTTSPEFTAFNWSSMTEVIFKQNAYPDTAHLALRFSAESFPRIPKRSFRLRGIKTKIPHNATVDIQTGRITYAGTFNGTFKTDKEWHSDPAWVLWDILTNTRYGLSVAESSLDQYTFYNQSVYNNELVDDGEGGQEARFAINVNITQQREAFNLINDICSVMRVMPFYAAGSISISGDRPSDPVYQFTLANVTEEGFTYSGSSLKTRHTVINVGYFDLETRAIDYETVEDTAAIAKYGTVIKTIRSFGCTSRGQASRMGKWFLYNEQKSGESCTFKITAESGTLVRCGQIISISDPVKAGLRRGGKIKSATTTSIVADDSTNTDLDSTNNATLSVIMPDGSLSTKTISSVSGTTINVSSAFLNSSNQAEAPNANSVFIIQNDTLESTTWRVITVKENPDLTFDVTALSHDSGKYAFVEDGVALPTRTTTVLTALKPAPSNLEAEEKIVVIDNKAVSKIFLNWQPVLGVNKYQVQYRFNNGNFILQNVISNTFDIENSQKGTYEVRVFSFNAIDKPSAEPAILTVNALGKTALPDDPTNVRIEPIQNTDLVRVRFDQSTSLDVLHGGFVEIRHSVLTDGTGTFFTAQELDKVAGNSTSATLPKLDGEYILKFVDDTGNRSAGEGSAIIALPEDQTFLSALTRREDQDNPKFQGTKTNTELDSTNTFLQLQDLGFDSITNFNTLDGTATLDEVLTIASSGTYDFGGAAGTTFLDLGGVFNVNFKRHLKSNGFLPNDNFDAIDELDKRQNFDGIDIANVSSDVLVAITQDDPSSGSPTYTAFQTFTNSNFKGRGFKFRCSMASTDPSASIKVTELGYTASFTRRTEQSPALITSSGATDVTFQAPFFTGAAGLGGTNSALPSVAITSQNMQSGDFFELTNITGTGFRITFKNGSSTVNRNFTYQAVGFAKGG